MLKLLEHKGLVTAAAILWLCLLFFLISVPGYRIPSFSWLSLLAPDKWAHCILFGVLAILWVKTLRFYIEGKEKVLFIVLVGCFAMSALTEILQASVFRFRTADLFDHIANCTGAFLGVYFFNFNMKSEQDGSQKNR